MIYLFTLLILVSISLNSRGQVSARTLTKEQIKADVAYLVSQLEETRVNPYSKITKPQFLKEINRAERKLLAKRKVSIIDLYHYLQPVIVHLEDGHTELYLNSYLDNTDYLIFPFKLSISSDGLIVTDIEKGYEASVSSSFIGKKIKRINGYSSAAILNIINQYSSGESKNSRLALSGYIFNTIFNLFLKKDEKLYMQWNDNIHLHLGILRKSDLPPDRSVNQSVPNYSYRIMEEKKLAIFTFTSFFNPKKFASFLSEMFSSLKVGNIKNLIIDVRSNGGGNSDLGDELLKYICPIPFTQYEKTVIKYSELSKASFKANAHPESEEFKIYLTKNNGTMDTIDKSKMLIVPETEDKRFLGNVYLLINQSTFSSAADFANAFNYYQLGKIIGEETGGFIISPGEGVTTKLPNSQLEVRISSSKDFDIGATDKDWHGVRPDLNVKSENALNYTINKLIL